MKNKIWIALYIISIIIFSCNKTDPTGPSPVEGGCIFSKIPGYATITSIVDANTNCSTCYNCPNEPVLVTFVFTPSNLTATNLYRFSRVFDYSQHLTVGAGMNPNRTYITNKGIKIGTTHAATRNEIISGSCSPLIYRFNSIDLTDYGNSCW